MSEDSPPSGFLKKTLNFGRDQRRPNCFKRKRGWEGRGGTREFSKKRGNRKGGRGGQGPKPRVRDERVRNKIRPGF